MTFFSIKFAKEPICKKSSENHDFNVAKVFFDFHVFLYQLEKFF